MGDGEAVTLLATRPADTWVMQNRTSGPYLAAMNKILISLVMFATRWPTRG
jgi:hypothetical protein